jgi:hypothetical protein
MCIAEEKVIELKAATKKVLIQIRKKVIKEEFSNKAWNIEINLKIQTFKKIHVNTIRIF